MLIIAIITTFHTLRPLRENRDANPEARDVTIPISSNHSTDGTTDALAACIFTKSEGPNHSESDEEFTTVASFLETLENEIKKEGTSSKESIGRFSTTHWWHEEPSTKVPGEKNS